MRYFTSLFLALSLVFMSCEGPQGIPGPPGLDGLPGLDGTSGVSFDVVVDFAFFSDTGLQEAVVALPFDIADSDVVLVYRLEKVLDLNGELVDAWAPLPQNFFLEGNDIIQYIFNHTYFDVELLIDGNFDLSSLDPAFTQEQVFKVAIIRADAVFNLDFTDINALIETGDIEQIDPNSF